MFPFSNLNYSLQGLTGAALTNSEFSDLFINFKKSAFRLETLPEYIVPGPNQEIQDMFERGESRPDHIFSSWGNIIKKHTDAGQSFTVVHILPHQLNSYLRCEIFWSYDLLATFGQDSRLIFPNTDLSPLELSKLSDYWLFDDTLLVKMNYDEKYIYKVAEIIEDQELVRNIGEVTKVLIQKSVPLAEAMKILNQI